MKNQTNHDFRNILLKSLSQADFKRIKQKLEKVEMPVGKTLYHSAEKVDFIYFPETCVISVVMELQNGDTVESGIIGYEGFSGAAVILTEEISPQEATIQLTGDCFRLPIADFQKLFKNNTDFRDVTLHYIYAFITQISQNAACLCHHKINQRLARWLLMFDDRSSDEKMKLTQQYIAQMLGVHRPTVSKNANELQQQGYISYNRGTVKILDRKGLEGFSCECYYAIKRQLKGFTDVRIFEKPTIHQYNINQITDGVLGNV